MFKHILIPTDGSPVANKASRSGIRLAKSLGARVTGYFAIEALRPQAYAEGYLLDPDVRLEFDRQARKFGDKHLSAMGALAKRAGVRFESVNAKADTPYDGIIAISRRRKCDLILMASHGRSGIAKLVMGSVTQRVLAESKIPVLVYR